MESKKLKGLYIMFLAIFLFLLICTYFDNQEILKNQESFRMYYEHTYQKEYKKNNTGVSGIYYPSDDYYCVWTKDMVLSEIQATDYHESCHALIDSEQRTHFCGEAQ